jgi:hypothetical protein
LQTVFIFWSGYRMAIETSLLRLQRLGAVRNQAVNGERSGLDDR